jgi:hypothetical protein
MQWFYNSVFLQDVMKITTRTHAHTHAYTRTRARTHTQTHTHTYNALNLIFLFTLPKMYCPTYQKFLSGSYHSISYQDIANCFKYHSNIVSLIKDTMLRSSGVPRNFFRGGVQQIQLRTERTWIWGAAAP